jgi:predicted  nucleic acid-binding Zn-ribbon protein
VSFNLQAILTLGEIDADLIRLRERLARAPEQSAPQEERVVTAKAECERLKDAAKLANRGVKKFEAEAEAKKQTITKSEVALNTAKSNTEYQAHLKNIDNGKEALSAIETQILEAYDADEEGAAAKKAGDKRFVDLQKDLVAAKKRVSDYEADLSTQIAALEAKRDDAAGEVGGAHREHYEKVLGKSGDSAVARVDKEMCQGCYNKVRPNQLSQIRGRKELVTCWTCGRVLYSDAQD